MTSTFCLRTLTPAKRSVPFVEVADIEVQSLNHVTYTYNAQVSAEMPRMCLKGVSRGISTIAGVVGADECSHVGVN